MRRFLVLCLKVKDKMKLIILTIMALLATHAHASAQVTQEGFTSQKISKTASFIVNSKIEQVFPLYGAFEERKWAPGWEPVLIFPGEEIIQEGTTFRTKIKNSEETSEDSFLWIVTKYKPEDYLIQYLVSTTNRFWTITVSCEKIGDSKTKTTVTYAYTSLNEVGDSLNQRSLEKMFENDLRDWGQLINQYFQGAK